MTTKCKCSAKTPDMNGILNINPCARSATVERNGKRYCWQHDPERLKADAEKRLTVWEAERDRLATVRERHARNAQLAELVTPELAELLKQLANMAVHFASRTEAVHGINHPLTVKRSKCIEEARTLAARIREALEKTG